MRPVSRPTAMRFWRISSITVTRKPLSIGRRLPPISRIARTCTTPSGWASASTCATLLVRGLETTRPNVVRSRILIHPGDPISQSLIGETQQKLYDLGIFSKVQTALQNPDGDEESKYVLFQLDEAAKILLQHRNRSGTGAHRRRRHDF